MFIIERRKCLLLVHADALFSDLDTNVRVARLDDLGFYVATLVVDALASEGRAGTTLGPVNSSRSVRDPRLSRRRRPDGWARAQPSGFALDCQCTSSRSLSSVGFGVPSPLVISRLRLVLM